MSTKSKLLFFLGFLFLSVSVLIIVAYPYIYRYLYSLLKDSKESSVFSKLAADKCDPNNTTISNSSDCKRATVGLPNDAAKKYVLALKDAQSKDVKVDPSKIVWDWKTSRIMATIIGKDLSNQSLYIYIDSPASAGDLYRVSKNVKILCSPAETAMLSTQNIVFLEGDFNLVDRIQDQDMLSTFCMDEYCSSIGKECILLRKQK